MQERTEVMTVKGQPLTLIGPEKRENTDQGTATFGPGIFIIDKQGFIRYLQYVREMSEHPLRKQSAVCFE